MAILNYFPTDPRGQAMFAFDHANEHQTIASAIGNPSAFNLQGYLLDPPIGQEIPNGNWQSVHQQAHDDAGYYFSQASLQLVGEGATTAQWLFINSTEHVALNSAILAGSLA